MYIFKRLDRNNDNECSVCRGKSVSIVKGETNCYYCGNEVYLCEKCLNKLKGEILKD